MAKTSATIDVSSLKIAGERATGYITDITNGICVHKDDDNWDETTGNSVKITDVVDIVRNGETVSSFGETVRVGKKYKSNYSFTEDEIIGYNSGVECFKISKGTSTDVRNIENVRIYGPSQELTKSIESKTLLHSTTTQVTIPLGTSFVLNGSGSISRSQLGAIGECVNCSAERVSPGGISDDWIKITIPNISFVAGTEKTVHVIVNIRLGYTAFCEVDCEIHCTKELTIEMRLYADKIVANYSSNYTEINFSEFYFTSVDYTFYPPSTTIGTRSPDSISSYSYAFTAGQSLFPARDGQAIFGKYNYTDTNKLFIIGNGTDDTHRSNAFTIDSNGNVNIPAGAKYQIGTRDILDIIYPVGSIYMSVNSTDPATLFGGTWQRITGRFLLAATDGGSSGASQAAGNTGGSPYLQAHTHSFTGSAHSHDAGKNQCFLRYNQGTVSTGVQERSVASGASGNYKAPVVNNANTDWSYLDKTSSETVGGTVGAVNTSGLSTGNAGNMPPYLSVYVWKRTA